MVRPNCLYSASQQFRILRQCRERHADRAGSGDMGFLPDEGSSDPRTPEPAIPGGSLQHLKSRKFQHAESDRCGIDSAPAGQHDGFDPPTGKSDCGTEPQHLDGIASDSVWTEIALVTT